MALLLLVSACQPGEAGVPRDQHPTHTRISVVINESVEECSSAGPITVSLVVPVDLPGRQVVVSEHLTPAEFQRSRVGDTHLVTWKFPRGTASCAVEAAYVIDLAPRLGDARLPPIAGWSRGAEADAALLPEAMIDSEDVLVTAIVAELPEGKGRMERAEWLVQYVGHALSYRATEGRDLGSREALRLGYGDCAEHADLFAALCRAARIPARSVAGFATPWNAPLHAWVEVQDEAGSWRLIDPLRRRFHGWERNNYVALSYDRIPSFGGARFDRVEWGNGSSKPRIRYVTRIETMTR